MRHCIKILVGIFVLLQGFVSAQTLHKSIGISGADVRSIYYANGKLYAGTSTGNIYVSTNQGNSWIKANMPYSLSTNFPILKVYVSGTRLFAATNYALFYSDDDGQHWTTTAFANPVIVTDIISNGSKLFIITNRSGMYSSVTNGASFVKVNDPVFANDSDLRRMYIDANGSIYVSPYSYINYHYLRSDDGGDNWTTVYIPEVATDIHVLNNRIYISSYYHAYYSDNNWVNYKELDLTKANSNARTFLMFNTPASLFFYFNVGALKTNDSGVTMQSSPFQKSIHEMTRINSRIFVASGAGIFWSDDEGTTWTKSDNGIEEFSITKSISIGDTYVLATSSAGIFTSTDFGDNWQYASTSILEEKVTSLVKDEKGNLFGLMNEKELYKSIDKGFTWGHVGSIIGTSNTIKNLIYFNGKFFINDGNHQFYSIDTALKQPSIIGDFKSVEYLFNSNTHVFACTSQGLYASNDGLNWSQNNSSPGFSLYSTYNYASTSTILGLNVDGRLYYSFDNGKTWGVNNLSGMNANGCAIYNNAIQLGNNQKIASTTDGNSLQYTNSLFSDNTKRTSTVFADHDRLFFTKTSDGLWYLDYMSGVIDPKQNPQASIYPNPTSNILNIINGNSQPIGTIELFDIAGRLILNTIPIDQSSYLLSFQDFESGVYMLTMGDKTYKIIKN